MQCSVAALFVRRDSVYKSLGVDCWDIDRDARLWPGGVPCICHPPCRAWGQLSHMAKPRPDERELAIWSIHQIRENGGVLEHPRASKLWPFMRLPKPGAGVDQFGGYSISVNQFWWGHPAQKATFLYIVGCPLSELPLIPLKFDAVEFVVASSLKRGSGRQPKRYLNSVKGREGTPPLFAKWLIDVARKCTRAPVQ